MHKNADMMSSGPSSYATVGLCGVNPGTGKMETGTLQGTVACQSTQSGELYVQSENVSKIYLESSKGSLPSLDL